jgi:hypothetical protein
VLATCKINLGSAEFGNNVTKATYSQFSTFETNGVLRSRVRDACLAETDAKGKYCTKGMFAPGVRSAPNRSISNELRRIFGPLAMNLDVSSDQIHYAKTIHYTRYEHTFSEVTVNLS